MQLLDVCGANHKCGGTNVLILTWLIMNCVLHGVK